MSDAQRTPDECCIWTPVVHPSGRISTLFYRTKCGEVGALPDKPKYCYLCGAMIDLVDREHVREYLRESQI